MYFLVKIQTVMPKKRKRHHTHPGELQAPILVGTCA